MPIDMRWQVPRTNGTTLERSEDIVARIEPHIIKNQDVICFPAPEAVLHSRQRDGDYRRRQNAANVDPH